MQFEEEKEQSVYTDQESLSSFDIPARRSARNADNVSVCSTEASDYQSNSDQEEKEEDDDDDSVCAEAAKTLSQFQVPKAAASINAERYNQFTRVESRKYTSKFSFANQATPSSAPASTDQASTDNASNNDKLVEQIKQLKAEAPQIIPGIPVVPLATTANAAVFEQS